MKVRIDSSKCAGHAQCAVHGPDLYQLDDAGYSLPLDTEVPEHLHGQARAGAAACPERAIEIGE